VRTERQDIETRVGVCARHRYRPARQHVEDHAFINIDSIANWRLTLRASDRSIS
jgi:hypothetical protein